MIQLTFEHGQMYLRHGIWSCRHRFCIGFNFDVNIYIVVDTESAIKEFLVTLEYVQKVAFLMCREVMLIFNNVSNISPLVLGIEDLSCIQLEPVLAKKLILMLDEIGVFHVVKVF